MGFQIGIDVGGTFTNLVIGNATGEVFKTKSPSTPGDESVGIMDALTDAAAAYELELSQVLTSTDVMVFGTTAVTNMGGGS